MKGGKAGREVDKEMDGEGLGIFRLFKPEEIYIHRPIATLEKNKSVLFETGSDEPSRIEEGRRARIATREARKPPFTALEFHEGVENSHSSQLHMIYAW